MKSRDDGVSEVLDETLIIALGIVCAVITMMLIFGVLPTIQKTAYVVPQYGIKNVSGGSAIYLFSRGGDAVYFNATPPGGYKTTLYVDTSAGTFTAVPNAGLNVFKPGDLVYLYYTGSGFIITSNLTGTSVTALPPGQLIVRMVDASSGVLISQEIVVKGNTTPTTTATATATAIPTATATTATRTVTVTWSPPGLGYGSVSPPTQLSNGQEVTVTRGSSKTFYFVPNPNSKKSVLSITLDGSTVYSGSSNETTISYTVTNIAEDRTLIAKFG
jgi:hypothetical protein